MTCGDVGGLAPLYLSGELTGAEHERFVAHLASCPACQREIELQSSLDERLVRAMERDLPDTARLEQCVRNHIAAERPRRWWVAAGVAAAIAGIYGLVSLASTPRMYADAARDHWAEVVEQQPRRWRAGPDGIEPLAAQSGLGFAHAAALAPAGYSLERAKICGLDGQRMLHLVFANGALKYSVYVRPHQSAKGHIRMIRRDSEQVAAFETGRFAAVVVLAGSAAECETLAKLTSRRL
jgi:anti-sigma factor RsiW